MGSSGGRETRRQILHCYLLFSNPRYLDGTDLSASRHRGCRSLLLS